MPPSSLAVADAPPRRTSVARGPLRLLDITDFYSETLSGGVRTYLSSKARVYGPRDAVEHAVIVPGRERDTLDLRGSRMHVIRGPVLPVSPAYRLILTPGAVREVVRQERPHVIEVGSPFIVPWLVHHAVGGLSVRTVGFYHADVIRTFAEPYVRSRAAAPLRVALRNWARRFVRRVYSKFDATVAASPSVAAELRELGVPNVRCIALGTDLETFRPLPPEERLASVAFGAEDGRPVGVYVGRFAQEKRLDVVLEGHARMPEAGRPHLALIGGGPLQESLEAWAGRHPHVSVLPYVSRREELARLYASADFYVAPGPGETFGLSIAEAMASGLPVVAVERGGGPDRVRGAGLGHLYTHGDPASAAAALERMTGELSEDLRRAVRAHAEAHFRWERTFEELLELYRELAPAVTA